MRVRQLIDLLLDQPMNNTVYVGDIANGVENRSFDGEVEGVHGSAPGAMATFIEFGETGFNNMMTEEN